MSRGQNRTFSFHGGAVHRETKTTRKHELKYLHIYTLLLINLLPQIVLYSISIESVIHFFINFSKKYLPTLKILVSQLPSRFIFIYTTCRYPALTVHCFIHLCCQLYHRIFYEVIDFTLFFIITNSENSL